MKNVKEILASKKRKMNISHSHSNEHHHHTPKETAEAATLYQCPMKCEGEKTYEEPGVCPVCNMNLAPVE